MKTFACSAHSLLTVDLFRQIWIRHCLQKQVEILIPPLLPDQRTVFTQQFSCQPSQVYLSRGHTQMTSTQFSGFWTPSPLVCILARSIVLNPRNLPYYICIWVTPPPSQCRRHLGMAPYSTCHKKLSKFVTNKVTDHSPCWRYFTFNI